MTEVDIKNKGENIKRKRAVSVKEGLKKLLPDSLFIRLMYFHIKGRALHLKNPKSYNEKLQWMKLYYHNPLCRDLTDKYKARSIVKDRIGDKYLIPLLGVYNNFDEIDFDALPERFVIKCNHDSGGVAICRDKKTFDIDAARAKLEKGLSTNFYYAGREWQYKYIKPKLICEAYIEDEPGDVKDYKIFCFDGVPKLIHYNFDRATNLKKNIYDIDWNLLDVEMDDSNHPDMIANKPENLAEMLEIASKLSKGFPHVRVDLYNIEGSIYFGEMTFTNMGGNGTCKPESFDYEMGSWFKLPPEMTLRERMKIERSMRAKAAENKEKI